MRQARKGTASITIGLLLELVGLLCEVARLHGRRPGARCSAAPRPNWFKRLELRDDLSHPLLGDHYTQSLTLRDKNDYTVRAGAYRSGAGWRWRGRVRYPLRYHKGRH